VSFHSLNIPYHLPSEAPEDGSVPTLLDWAELWVDGGEDIA
jgi:hypothetical protein